MTTPKVGSWLPKGLGPLVVEVNGTPTEKRLSINFVASGATVTDDAETDRTTITLPAATVPTGTGLRKVVSGAEAGAAALLVNADVDAAAAIAGSKIAPDFSTATVRAKEIRLGVTSVSATGNIDALDPSGASIVRLTGAGAVSVRGILGGSDGDVLIIHNRTGNTVTLVHESGAVGDATRRYEDPGAADYPFASGSVHLYYDGAASRWVRTSYM